MSYRLTAAIQVVKIAVTRHRGDLTALAILIVFYTTTVWVAAQSTFGHAIVSGSANVVPVVIFGLAARPVIRGLVGRPLPVQAVGHAILCAVFSFFSYWLLLVLLAVANSPSPLNFLVQNFVTRGMAWQLLENVTTYGVIACLTYAQAYARMAQALSAVPAVTPPPAGQAQKETSRYLVRSGDELRPIDLDRIVSISGADDYAELTTLDGKRLVAMTLAEFEATLDPARFVRVHRSRIVNLDFLDRTEPAGGGRLLLHMQTGEVVSTSRTGARLLKSRVI